MLRFTYEGKDGEGRLKVFGRLGPLDVHEISSLLQRFSKGNRRLTMDLEQAQDQSCVRAICELMGRNTDGALVEWACPEDPDPHRNTPQTQK